MIEFTSLRVERVLCSDDTTVIDRQNPVASLERTVGKHAGTMNRRVT